MFFPYNTDAPIYYFPYTTIGLIIVNTLMFFGFCLQLGGPEPTDSALLLDYGTIAPWQWLTSIFMHADIMHLIGNMIFLWAFGLVVEGKVGPLVFLGLYLGIGVLQSGIEQSMMLFAGEGGSLGASAAIFGLLGVVLIWAPKNEFEVFWLFGFRMGTFEMPIMIFGFIQFAFEFVAVVLGSFQVSSGVLHLMGFGIGLAAGALWVKRGWVDCEGWDVFNVLRGNEGARAEHEAFEDEAADLVKRSFVGRDKEAEQPKHTTPGYSHENHKYNTADDPNMFADGLYAAEEDSTPTFEDDLQQLFDAGQYATAVKLIEKHKSSGNPIELSQPILAKLVRGLLGARSYEVAVPYMQEHAQRFSVARVPMLLNLAKTLLHLEKPRKAQKALRTAQKLEMDEKSKQQWRTLAKHSKKQIEEGAIELSD